MSPPFLMGVVLSGRPHKCGVMWGGELIYRMHDVFFFPFQDVLDVASQPNLLKDCDLRFCLMLEVERRPKFHIWSIHLSWIKLKILHFISHQIEHKPKRNKVYKNSILNMITTCYILDSLIKFNDVVELINKIWLI